MLLLSDALAILVVALLVDALVGDPDAIWRRWPHPVAWLGAAISWSDRHLNRDTGNEASRRAAGMAALAVVVGLSFLACYLVQELAENLPAGGILLGCLASVFIAQRSLFGHVARVQRAFGTDGLPGARRAVSMIVGRDPDRLDEAGVARAAIESTAENFSDGIVAPAFWFALLGLPGLVAYKAVNTADSMIGHLSARHRSFGWAAARLDDLLNLIPSRLSGLLIGLCAPLGRGRVGDALAVMGRDARRHRSPNAGWPEAAMAGALGVRLAGPRIYPSGLVSDPYLNPDGRDASPDDIRRGLRVMIAACILHAAIYLGLAVVLA